MESKKEIIVITGSAPNTLEDLEACHDVIGDRPRLYMAIGLDAVDKYAWPIRYMATYHPAEIPEILKRRAAINGNTDYEIISQESRNGVAHCIGDWWKPSGSSSLLGVQAALRLGYHRIILCGCPLEGKNEKNGSYENFRNGWIPRVREIDGRVRSMSGWTRSFLGAPDAAWLGEYQGRITIGANWDGGPYYDPEYVNRLYRACLRNTSIPFDFVLYVGPEAEKPGRTDAIDPHIRIVPVGLPSWWSGMSFWRPDPPGIDTGTILYLDIDQVIVGNLDDIIRFPSNHACMKDYPASSCPSGKEKDGCVSTTLIRNGAGAKVWEAYVRAGMPVWNPIIERGPLPMAAQGIINDPDLAIPHDLFPEAWVCSYKLEVLKRGLPEDCRIVSFHGRPKPHEVSEAFVEEHWK